MPCTCGVCQECNWARNHPDEDPAFKDDPDDQVEFLRDYDKFVDDMWCLGRGVYDPADFGGMPELGYLGLCLAGERGEVAEKIKKAYRENSGKTDKVAIVKELGDVLYYLTKLAHIHGFSLNDVAKFNKVKLLDRQKRGTLLGSGDDR